MDYEKLWSELRERLFTDAEKDISNDLKVHICIHVTEMMGEMEQDKKHESYRSELNAQESTRP
ncbi:hypothetical protein SBF1_50126 [Candidatus Desulfosporosinus infrequens]|uniref:Uncharacterized protein n=1 Tax=Candidatus Desulfosporosinus infrequens TaxID=2043169 RepID=A0A2U3LH84_9FIRM|nr:hypothetical protein SBF1_50126 [Candidatus Desulfosporosinus infrequens]